MSSFSSAFKAARKELGAGKTFEWEGKRYSTNLKDEKPAKPTAPAKPPVRQWMLKDTHSILHKISW